jgi:hypothetical protein
LRVLELCHERGAPKRATTLSAPALASAVSFLAQELKRWLSAEENPGLDTSIDLTVLNVAAGIRGLFAERVKASGIDTKKLKAGGIKWLLGAQNPDNGGWGWYKGAASELLPTYHAVWALDLVRESYAVGEKPYERLQACTDGGREYLSSLAREMDAGCCWRQTSECTDPSPAATALAVLSLSHSEREEHLRLAQGGARWLLDNPRRWCRTGERAYEVILPTEDGRFPNLSLCPLACVHDPGFSSLPESKALIGRALEHIEGMWRPDLGGFAHEGYSPYVGMTRTILSLDRAISRRGEDWGALARLSRRRRQPTPGQRIPGWSGTLAGGDLVLIDETEGTSTYVPVSEEEKRILRFLHGQDEGQSTVEEASEELGIPTVEAVEKAIRRLNEKVAARFKEEHDLYDPVEFDNLVSMEKRQRSSPIKRIWLRCALVVSEQRPSSGRGLSADRHL